MNDIQTALLTVLPSKRKSTPSGWIAFDAPCCIHRNESRDERQRGGILTNANGGFQYHCFNCNFAAGWTPGHNISNNTKSLFKWLGMTSDDILKLGLFALKLRDRNVTSVKKLSFELEEKKLPDRSMSILEWARQDLEEEIKTDLLKIFKYLDYRGMDVDWYPWHWSPSPGYRDRLLIPFYHEGKVVGFTGRKITEGRPKYLTDAQPGYVFNLDRQKNWDRKYLIVTEGQLDAIAIDGVAIMHNEPNETQASRINTLGKDVIVVPDNDRPGAKLVAKAVEYNWSVSLPPWEDDVKDVSDAVKKYGRLYTLYSILQYRETNVLKIQLLQKKLENL
jgi:hypothetical protein